METTNKKQMRSLLFELQRLQREAFDLGFNLNMGTRNADGNEPWICGHVNKEGCDFINDEEGTTHLYFAMYDHRSFVHNTEELTKIKNYIHHED